MQMLITLSAIFLVVAYFFRWIIVGLATLIGMFAFGFLAGFGIGFFVWMVLKLSYFMVFIVAGYRIFSEPYDEA